MDIGNIYAPFRQAETWMQVPFIPVPVLTTDKQEVYVPGVSLMTRVSMKFYGVPYMGKFIQAANPTVINEFDIEEETLLRIPFPLEQSLKLFREAVDEYLKK